MVINYRNIIESMYTELDGLLNNYVFHAYSTLATYLKTPLGLAMVLYITLMGLAITQGWVRLNMANFIKATIKLALVYTAAMHWGWFSHNIVSVIQNGAEQIGKVLIDATLFPQGTQPGEGVNGALQSVLIEFTEIGAWSWSKGSLGSSSSWMTALLIWGFGYALILVALLEVVLAKIMLAVLFATAPLFVGFTLFKPTHGFFDRWLGACVGFGLLIVFISSLLALALSLTQWVIADIYAKHASDLSLVGFVPIMVVGFINIGVILKAAQLAQGIGGAVTTTSGSALLAGSVGGALSGSISVLPSMGQNKKGADIETKTRRSGSQWMTKTHRTLG